MTAGAHDLTPARALLRTWEGLRLHPYVCPAGRVTIGYGHVVRDGAGRPLAWAAAAAQSPRGITAADAETLLRADVADTAARVDALLRTELADHQFNALVSFAFNTGSGAFARSTLLRHVNARRWSLVPAELRRWVHVGGLVCEGLRRRREAEVALWEGRT